VGAVVEEESSKGGSSVALSHRGVAGGPLLLGDLASQRGASAGCTQGHRNVQTVKGSVSLGCKRSMSSVAPTAARVHPWKKKGEAAHWQ